MRTIVRAVTLLSFSLSLAMALAVSGSTAAAAGIEAMVLETGMKQPEAIALYLSSGYEPIPGFGYYCGSELSRCFGRRITPAS